MQLKSRAAARSALFGLLLVLTISSPAQGQYNGLLSALFGGSSNSPSTPTVISTTTPSSTSSTTTEATPSATSTTDTPSSSSATASSTTTAASPASSSATAEAAAPDTPAITPLPRSRVPSPTRRAVAPPPPPAPIVIDPAKQVPALPADQSVMGPAAAPPATGPSGLASDVTAVDVVLQVSGPGVTPFVVPQQTVLLRAMSSVLTTVSLRDLSIRYVTSAAESRRRLLQQEESMAARALLAASPTSTPSSQGGGSGQLYNVASVTLQANCSSNTAVPATLAEMQSVVRNNLLSSAIQSYGQPQWGVQLLSLTAVNPNVALAAVASCKKNFGAICLDNTSLSVAAVEVIIAIGAVVLVMIVALPCVLLEWRRKSGQMAELEPVPQTPRTPLDHVQQIYNKLIDTVKAASPMHKRGSSAGRNAFRNESPIAAAGGKGHSAAVQMSARGV